jgi:hypothetical protein
MHSVSLPFEPGQVVRFKYQGMEGVTHFRRIASVQGDSVTFVAAPHNNAQQTFDMNRMQVLNIIR